MRGTWRIGRLMGIDISLDLSWFIVFFLLVYSFGFVEFPRELHPRTFFPRVDAVSITLGIAASLLLFASVLAHELSHSWMAIQRGIPVMNITLFIFGGIAQISDEPETPGTEFLIAIMGPLMSAALAALFGAAWLWLRIADSARFLDLPYLPFLVVAGIIAQANGALAIFNLAPGFPLDGGRVLRAALWAVFQDIRRATLWASRMGQFIAALLVGYGAWLFVTEFDGGGIWYALIGVFLWSAARRGYRQAVTREMLRGIRVSQLMTRSLELVHPSVTLDRFIREYVVPRREQTFVVTDGTGWLGTISTDNLARIPRSQWAVRCVGDSMVPSSKHQVLRPIDSASTALALISRGDIEEVPVVDSGNVVGFLGRNELSRFLRFGVASYQNAANL